jgi:hypothetical protein
MTAKLAATAKPKTGLKLNLCAALGLANCSSTKASILLSIAFAFSPQRILQA